MRYLPLFQERATPTAKITALHYWNNGVIREFTPRLVRVILRACDNKRMSHVRGADDGNCMGTGCDALELTASHISYKINKTYHQHV